jgi:hypothetical protein
MAITPIKALFLTSRYYRSDGAANNEESFEYLKT